MIGRVNGSVVQFDISFGFVPDSGGQNNGDGDRQVLRYDGDEHRDDYGKHFSNRLTGENAEGEKKRADTQSDGNNYSGEIADVGLERNLCLDSGDLFGYFANDCFHASPDYNGLAVAGDNVGAPKSHIFLFQYR